VTVRAHVLVVDDEEGVRDFLRELLDMLGYDATCTATAAAGLVAARQREPDAILLDLSMPGTLTGADALTSLARYAPVIIVTASVDLELGRRLLREGAFDYVNKPFDIERLTMVLAAAVEHGRAR
jgi:two-component system response regulator AtoC